MFGNFYERFIFMQDLASARVKQVVIISNGTVLKHLASAEIHTGLMLLREKKERKESADAGITRQPHNPSSGCATEAVLPYAVHTNDCEGVWLSYIHVTQWKGTGSSILSLIPGNCWHSLSSSVLARIIKHV